MQSSIYFKRGAGGVLETTNLHKVRLEKLSEDLIYQVFELSKQGEIISRSDLEKKRGKGKDIANALKDNIKSFNHARDMKNVINFCLENGRLEEIDFGTQKRGAPKKILRVQ